MEQIKAFFVKVWELGTTSPGAFGAGFGFGYFFDFFKSFVV